MTGIEQTIARVAAKHGLGSDAVRALWSALVSGRGLQAQFTHPELGGMGQWSGGMVQIGDMFNPGLKARVAAACADLAPLAERIAQSPLGTGAASRGSAAATLPRRPGTGEFEPWWPPHLGQPASVGAQNGARYAYFPDRHRLCVARDGTVVLYDTGQHRISGFAQHQATCSAMIFTSQSGPVMLDALPVVDA